MFRNHGSALDFFRLTLGWKLEAYFFSLASGMVINEDGFQSYYSGAEASKRGASASCVFDAFCIEL